MNIPALIFENLVSKFSIKILKFLVSKFSIKILKFFDADPGSGILYTLDPGWKKSDSGSGINISDPQHTVVLVVL